MRPDKPGQKTKQTCRFSNDRIGSRCKWHETMWESVKPGGFVTTPSMRLAIRVRRETTPVFTKSVVFPMLLQCSYGVFASAFPGEIYTALLVDQERE